jgi:hypothetical protein
VVGFVELVRSRSKGGVEVRVEVPEKEAYDFILAGYGKAGRWGFDGEDDAVGYGDSIKLRVWEWRHAEIEEGIMIQRHGTSDSVGRR